MMQTNTPDMYQRIIQHCRQQHWYAGDIDNTAHFSERDERYEAHYDSEGNEIVIDNDPDGHPRKTSFAYPPATKEQLAATERALGYVLPSLLRGLYMHIANGGFGPGHGLIGALGGFCEAGDIVDNYQFHAQSAQLIELDDDVQQGKILELPDTMWPRQMLYLCDWPYGVTSCIDCRTESVYLRLPSERNLHYRLQLQSSSLTDWLERWLRGELHYELPAPDVSAPDISNIRLLFASDPISDEDKR